MRIKFLLISLLAIVFSVQSQNLSSVWDRDLGAIRDSVDGVSKEVFAVSTTGDIYASGVFNKEFSFAESTLTPLANSTYLVKFGENGSQKWGVSFTGAATPQCMTTDPNGNIYVAGTILGEVTFNGVSAGNSFTLTGSYDFMFESDLVSGFVVKYDNNGTILAAESFNPESMSIPGDLLYFGMPEFNFKSLQFFQGKLYASAIYAGDITKGDYVFSGSYTSVDFIAGDILTGTVFSMSDGLSVDGILSTLETERGASATTHTLDAKFIISAGRLFVTYAALGDLILKTGTQTENISIKKQEITNPQGNYYEFALGYLVMELNMDGTLKTKKLYEGEPQSSENYMFSFNRISGLYTRAGELVIAGEFNAKLPFNNEIVTLDNNVDLYYTLLNLSDFSMTKSVGLNTSGSSFISSCLVGKYLVGAMNNTKAKTSSMNIIDLVNNQINKLDNVSGTYYTGVGANFDKLLSAKVDNTDSETASVSINESVIDNSQAGIDKTPVSDVTVYPNPVIDMLNLSKPSDVIIYSAIGSVVKQATAVTQVNVSDLSSGIYYIQIKAEDGIKTQKIIKR